MKRIARWSTIFLLLCSIIWAGTASAAMIVENNMSALNTLNTINKNQTPQGKDSALERLAKEIGAGMWDNTDWDDPAFQENIGRFGITVLKRTRSRRSPSSATRFLTIWAIRSSMRRK